jgi:hypothetical protein
LTARAIAVMVLHVTALRNRDHHIEDKLEERVCVMSSENLGVSLPWPGDVACSSPVYLVLPLRPRSTSGWPSRWDTVAPTAGTPPR